MPLVNVLDWRTGRGWIVLAGNALNADEDNDVDLDVEAKALTKLSVGEPIAYVYAASGDADAAELHLESLDEMGAPTGYLVDILTEDWQSVRRQIREAGMVLLADGPDVDALRAGLQGAANASMGEAHDRGAVIFGIGTGAEVLGAHLDGTRGLAWLADAIIMTGVDDDERMEMLRLALETRPEAYGIGISSRSAIAFGSRGEIEIWGERRVTILLGQNATAHAQAKIAALIEAQAQAADQSGEN